MRIPLNISELIEKFQSGTATPEELHQLNQWYHAFDDSEVEILSAQTKSDVAAQIQLRVLQTINEGTAPRRKSWRIPAAAAVLLLIVLGIYFLLPAKKNTPQEIAKTSPTILNTVIAPGGNKALLTLDDGSTIVLDSAGNGILGTQGNIKIEKLDNGLLTYKKDGKTITENDEAFYNTITTPRGGQYQITLSDGTKVWLNAASSIRFPVLFTGKERRVIVTGETYFEVAHNDAMPFKIKAVSSEVEVMGTHFNINAYDDEAVIKTTLVEGRVKVYVPVTNGFTEARFLLPGQQSSISKSGTINVANNADIEEAVAWKNGRFQYKSADIATILRQIARWYDVEVEYKGNVSMSFTGQLTRSASIAKVIEKLKLAGELQYKIEGRKIIVSR